MIKKSYTHLKFKSLDVNITQFERSTFSKRSNLSNIFSDSFKSADLEKVRKYFRKLEMV